MLGISSISDTRIMNMTGLVGMDPHNLNLYSQRLKQLAEKLKLGVSQPSTQRSSSMIAGFMSKFGFSDIQEFQEAYKKTILLRNLELSGKPIETTIYGNIPL